MPTDIELARTLDGLGRGFQEFKQRHDQRLEGIESFIERADSRMKALDSLADGRGGSTSRDRTGLAPADLKDLGDLLRSGALGRKDVTTTSGGGSLIPERIATSIIAKALSMSRLPQLVRRTRTDTSDYTRVVLAGHPAASWVSETGTRSATSDPDFRAVQPPSGECYSYFSCTNWALQSSQFDLGREFVEAVSRSIAKAAEAAIIVGTGTNQPLGVLHNTPTTAADEASPQRAWHTFRYRASGQAGGLGHSPYGSPQRFGDERLLDLFFDLRPEYRANATWVMNSATLAAVRKFKDASGTPLWQPSLGVAMDQGGGPDGMLLGKPVVCSESMPAVGSNTFPIAIGDWTLAYEMVEIFGVDVTRDEVTSPGKTKYYIRTRLGGSPVDNDALRFLKAGTT